MTVPAVPPVRPHQLMGAPLEYHQTMHLNAFGYLPLPRRLDVALVREVGATMASLFGDRLEADVDEGLWHADPDVANRLFSSAAFADAAASIVGHDFVYVRSTCVRLSGDRSWRGGGGVLRWPLPHITLLLFPDAVDTASGCMRVVPFSHQNYLRLLDSRWDQAPDYLYGLRNPDLRWQHSAFGVADRDIPSLPLISEPGDLLVITEDALHASFGDAPRDYLAATFMARPRSYEQLHFLRQLHSAGGGLRPSTAMVGSAEEAVRRMIQPLVDMEMAA